MVAVMVAVFVIPLVGVLVLGTPEDVNEPEDGLEVLWHEVKRTETRKGEQNTKTTGSFMGLPLSE